MLTERQDALEAIRREPDVSAVLLDPQGKRRYHLSAAGRRVAAGPDHQR